MANKKTCFIVSHTHWDRAWYLPFESFRFRMIETVDTVLDQLKNEPGFKSFTLDGQSVLLEDYLEIRPEKRPELEKLISGNKLSVGPWYTLPDVFLSSGESLIRNLMMGIKLGKEFGNYLKVGYVPDPFGHISQMPQILKGFDLKGYLFMRGQPEDIEEDVFNWASPDGSSVTAVNLKLGYFFGAALGHPDVFGRFDGHDIESDLVKKTIDEYFDEPNPHGHPVLICNGGDHMPVQPQLPKIIEFLKNDYPNVDWVHGDFDQYINSLLEVRERSSNSLPKYSGELMGNKDHPILSNVFSSRVYLKKLHHNAQSLLAKKVEPIIAWAKLIGIDFDYTPYLNKMWSLLLKCQAHDDIGGCSIDEVHEDNEVSFKKIISLSNELLKDVLERAQKIGFNLGCEKKDNLGTYFVFNPHPFSVIEKVKFSLLIGEEELKENTAFDLVSSDGKELDFEVFDVNENSVRNNYLETTCGAEYKVETSVTVPALGYSVIHAKKAGHKTLSTTSVEERSPELENSTYKISYERESLNLFAKNLDVKLNDFLKIVYDPDLGDTYSFGPLPSAGTTAAKIISAKSINNKISLSYLLQIEELEELKDEISHSQSIEVELSFDCNDQIAIKIKYDNKLLNSRIRAHFKTGLTESKTISDGHFCLDERNHQSLKTVDYSPKEPAYPGETKYPTSFQGDFVILPGESHKAWIANKGLHEYEVISDGENKRSELAITLHRSVGALSVNGGGIRSCHAGPGVKTPGAQCLRELEHELSFGLGELEIGQIIQKSKSFSHPLLVTEMPRLPYVNAGKIISLSDSLLSVEEGSLIELSSARYCNEEEQFVVRLCNISENPQKSTMSLNKRFTKYMESNFFEKWDDSLSSDIQDELLDLEFKACEIKTLLIKNV